MGFCLLLKIWVEIPVKVIVKAWAVNTVRNFLIVLKNLQQMHLKLLQKEQFKKTAEATGDIIGNKNADRITKVSKTSPHNNSETNEVETLRERYTSLKQRGSKIGDLRLI